MVTLHPGDTVRVRGHRGTGVILHHHPRLAAWVVHINGRDLTVMDHMLRTP